MFCTNCGGQIADNSAFCPNCGATLSAPAQNPQPQQPVYPQQPTYPQQPAYSQQPYGNGGYAYGQQPAFTNEDAPRSVGFGEAIKICFNKYATFKGRASKSEFWWFYLFSMLISLTYIGSLVVFVPMLAVAVRRLHDTGKSGWYYLMCLIPLAGPIILLVQWCKDSVMGNNEYGPGPQPVYSAPYGTPYQPY